MIDIIECYEMNIFLIRFSSIFLHSTLMFMLVIIGKCQFHGKTENKTKIHPDILSIQITIIMMMGAEMTNNTVWCLGCFLYDGKYWILIFRYYMVVVVFTYCKLRFQVFILKWNETNVSILDITWYWWWC